MHDDAGPEILGARKEERNNKRADKNRDEVSKPQAQMTKRERSNRENAGYPDATEQMLAYTDGIAAKQQLLSDSCRHHHEASVAERQAQKISLQLELFRRSSTKFASHGYISAEHNEQDRRGRNSQPQTLPCGPFQADMHTPSLAVCGSDDEHSYSSYP